MKQFLKICFVEFAKLDVVLPAQVQNMFERFHFVKMLFSSRNVFSYRYSVRRYY